jgi:DNA topoisomerase I
VDRIGNKRGPFSPGRVFAESAALSYVTDVIPGIRRIRRGKSFAYFAGEKSIRDPETLRRINSLKIPPAWENVWICASENGHIQATGYDKLGRKQYRYHQLWNESRNRDKFDRLLLFGKKLPALRKKLHEDVSKKELCELKVLATVISLMEKTYIRVGNSDYEKAYGSYGLTTFKDDHVRISGNSIRFAFRGKKGIYHDITIRNQKLARIVKECRDIPGRELFQYYDANKKRHAIDSGRVNDYLKQITGEEFTAKDFRTWAGTLNALRAFRNCDESAGKKEIVKAIDRVSKQLGNSRAICRKYYIHPVIVGLFENKKLHDCLERSARRIKAIPNGLEEDEFLLLCILENKR